MERVGRAGPGVSHWATWKTLDIIPSERPLKSFRQGSGVTMLVFCSCLWLGRKVDCMRPGHAGSRHGGRSGRGAIVQMRVEDQGMKRMKTCSSQPAGSSAAFNDSKCPQTG